MSIQMWRVIDANTECSVCECSSYQEAWETLCQLKCDHYDAVYIEEYSVSKVRGLGRDPDLH